MTVREELLYYVWSARHFDMTNLRTCGGDALEVLQWGYRNFDSGPDFLDARIQMDGHVWAGHIEMHVRASDWYKHAHQHDSAYQNVILHVVMENDCAIALPNGEPLACIELKDRIDQQVIETYQGLMQARSWIPCARNRWHMSPPSLLAWYERLLVERLEDRTERYDALLMTYHGDWEEAFYILLARNCGFGVNADAFERLARSLPRRIIMRHRDRLLEIEALLFGQSGLLPAMHADGYVVALRQSYDFLRTKYELTPMQGHEWKFMRMRPANFPTVRMAQLAVMLHTRQHLFSKILAAENAAEVRTVLRTEVSGFWMSHYTFDDQPQRKPKKMGKASLDLLLINTVVPTLFYYGKVTDQGAAKDKALALLQAIEPESNGIVRKFEDLSFRIESAWDTQSLLQLKQKYCDKKRCLECAIGNSIMRGTRP